MIRETIVTTQAETGKVHIAPMGVHDRGDQILIMPFRPSTTLDNLLQSKCAIVNFTDDVRLFAGCLTGRKNWPLSNANVIKGKRLTNVLSHIEVELVQVEDDNIRPQLFCKIVHKSTHAPFRGFNRAQTSVLEAAILVSRLDRLPWSKIEIEIEYLRIAVEKTAGENELEAWGWLMQVIEDFKLKHPQNIAPTA